MPALITFVSFSCTKIHVGKAENKRIKIYLYFPFCELVYKWD